jgi:tetratricopeptide (TPR) repeat protein
MAHHYQDAWGLAIHHHTASMNLAEQIGYVEGLAREASNLGEVYLVQGRLNEAKKKYRQALEITERLGMAYGVALMHNNLGAVHARAGEWDEATKHLKHSLVLFEEIRSEEFLAELFRHRAETALGQGQPDDALVHAERSLGYAQTHDMRLEEGMSWRVLGRVRRERGDLVRAEEALARALEIARETHKRHEVALTHLELAHLRMEQGQEEEGRELARQAAQVFGELGAQLDLEEAERLLADGTM